MARNITEVRLLSVPLENDYKHTLWFASKSAQTSYFLSKTVRHNSENNFSYQRKDNVIRYPHVFDDLIDCNYVMYKNNAYGDKWFYAFITKMEYVNDERTDIYIETDVIQTYLFDYTVKPSFVEREHTQTDVYGDNTLPEGLQLGDYVCNMHTKSEYTDGDFYMVAAVSETFDGQNSLGYFYTGMYSGLIYFAFDYSTTGRTNFYNFCREYDDAGKADAIQHLFLAPKKLVSVDDYEGYLVVASTTTVDKFYLNHGGSGNTERNFVMSSGNLNGYSPKNKKLLTYPYRYLLCTNNCGTSVVYHYEEFRNPTTKSVRTPKFVIEGCLTPGCSIRMIPEDYKFATRNDEEGINMGKFPALNWTSDIFTNWLTQNAVNIGVSFTAGVADTILSGVTYNGGGVVNSLSSVGHTVGEVYKAALVPPQSRGNINSGDVITGSGQNDFHFYDMTIKKEYAEIIDGFFDMFGYKTNKVKTPNKNHRESYWYTKTIDVNIDGPVPMSDMKVIKSCYDNGITFWKNTSKIGDYSVSNEINVLE